MPLIRINVKINIDFLVILPYSEKLKYIIDDNVYIVNSYRALIFAVIIVNRKDKVNYNINSDIKKIFKS